MFSSQSRRTCKLGVAAAAASALRPLLRAALHGAKELSTFRTRLSLGGGFSSARFGVYVPEEYDFRPPV